MFRRFLFLPAVFVALPLSAKLIRIEPPAPTTGTAVRVMVAAPDPNGCHPALDRIERSDSRVTLQYRTGICLLTPYVWSDNVNIGTLAAGLRTIAVALDGRILDTYDLWVRDDDPPLRVSPSAKVAGAVERVEIATKDAFVKPTVIIGDTVIPDQWVTVVDPHTILATTMPHDPGLVDVTLREGTTSITAPGAFRFVRSTDPPDPAVYERILLPIVYNGFGAFGTWWRTDLRIFNSNRVNFTSSDSALPFYFTQCVTQPPCPGIIRPGENASVFGLLTKISSGMVIFPERKTVAGLRFASRIWEMDQDAMGLSSGTELPVVRERDFRTGKVDLASVPIDHHSRITLRIYGPDSQAFVATVRLFPVTEQPKPAVAEQTLSLIAPPCTTDPCDAPIPSFASISDLQQTFPPLADLDRVRIEIEALPGYRIWAFASITNNQTQHVTIVTPQ